MTFATQLLEDLRSPTRSLREAAPEAWGAFGDLHRAAFAERRYAARYHRPAPGAGPSMEEASHG